MTAHRIELTLGPLLFHWPEDRVRDLYARIADEAPIDRVYLGEVVCGKRGPRVATALAEAAERLDAAGKVVVWSTLALPATARELRASGELACAPEMVELNDASGLAQRQPGAPFVAGPFLNVYNEAAAAELARRGCVRLCGNVELSLDALALIGANCPALELELFAYGRLPLALSGRCYHARRHGRHKDACQFVCEQDPDGLDVRTIDGEPFLAVNGIQTLSYGVHLADAPVNRLREARVQALRLSPQTGDMVEIAKAFRRFADEAIDSEGLRRAVLDATPPAPLVNGYLTGAPGLRAVAIPKGSQP